MSELTTNCDCIGEHVTYCHNGNRPALRVRDMEGRVVLYRAVDSGERVEGVVVKWDYKPASLSDVVEWLAKRVSTTTEDE